MLHKCGMTCVLWVVGDVKFDYVIYFPIGADTISIPGQIRCSKMNFFNSKISFKIMRILSSLGTRFQNCHLTLRVTSGGAKNCVSETWHQLYLVFRPLHREKGWHCLGSFICMFVIGMYLDNIYSFLDKFNHLVLICIYFQKSKCFFCLGRKVQKSEISVSWMV